MVDRNLIASLDVSDDEAAALVRDAFGKDVALGDMDALLEGAIEDFAPGSILDGEVIGFAGDDVVIDVGLKSEGLISKQEFDDPAEMKPGTKVKVLLEQIEGENGLVSLSKRKADRIINWQRLLETCKEGQGHPQDQGRPARRYRRARVPARVAGGHPPPARSGRVHGSRDPG